MANGTGAESGRPPATVPVEAQARPELERAGVTPSGRVFTEEQIDLLS